MFDSPYFWVSLSFALFVLLTYKPIKKALVGFLDGKIAKIESDLAEAAKLRAEAEAMLATAKQRQASAAAEAASIVQAAEAEAQNIATRAAADLASAMARREQQALDRIKLAEQQALADIKQIAASVAVAAARDVLQAELTADTRSQLADTAISTIGKAA